MTLSDMVNEALPHLLHPRPYPACICGVYKPGKRHEVEARTQCQICGAWKKDEEEYQNER